ncbi:polysaccharide biosynthesis C-terminal domain-containing protein [Viscerimonas tarda]
MSIIEKIEIIDRSYINDDRGWFLKTLTGKENNLPSFTGEIYLTSAKEGYSKGNHYHKVATEWFTLISEKATLTLIDIQTGEALILELDSSTPQTIVVPPYVAHSFKNNFSQDFVLLAYANLHYNPNDTIKFDVV